MLSVADPALPNPWGGGQTPEDIGQNLDILFDKILPKTAWKWTNLDRDDPQWL